MYWADCLNKTFVYHPNYSAGHTCKSIISFSQETCHLQHFLDTYTCYLVTVLTPIQKTQEIKFMGCWLSQHSNSIEQKRLQHIFFMMKTYSYFLVHSSNKKSGTNGDLII